MQHYTGWRIAVTVSLFCTYFYVHTKVWNNDDDGKLVTVTIVVLSRYMFVPRLSTERVSTPWTCGSSHPFTRPRPRTVSRCASYCWPTALTLCWSTATPRVPSMWRQHQSYASDYSVSGCMWWMPPWVFYLKMISTNLLLNLRSPRDYVVRSSVVRSFAPVVCVR